MAMKRFKSVDDFIENLEFWQDEVIKLRSIALATELQETLKWSIPCYTIDGKNVAGIGAFKTYFGIWFFNGVFLQDKDNVLVNTKSGKTRGQRQWRFQSASEIKVGKIKAYLKEATELTRAGKVIKPITGQPVEMAPELASALDIDPRAAAAFAGMTVGRQREYSSYIIDAKRMETKINRVAKILPMIKQNIGLNDKYRK